MSNPSQRGLLKGPNNGILILGRSRAALGARVCASVGFLPRADPRLLKKRFRRGHGPLAPEGTSKTYSVRQVAPERLEWYPLYHTGTRSRSLRVVF